MQIRLAVLGVILCGASYGCATPAEEPAAKAPAAAAPASDPQPRQTGNYRTGSRLPVYEERGGASSVGDMSREDVADDMRRAVNPAQR